MSGTAVVIEEFASVAKNTLVGFARVRLPSGMILHDVSVSPEGRKRMGLATVQANDRPRRYAGPERGRQAAILAHRDVWPPRGDMAQPILMPSGEAQRGVRPKQRFVAWPTERPFAHG
jgi:hypothetical protein